MLVKECMTTQTEIGNPNMTLTEVAKIMRDGDFGALPIADNDRLIGMVTDRDIVIRGIAENLSPDEATAEEIMTEKILFCFEDQTLEEVAETLGENQIRRLPVLNRQKRLVGILSLGDLAKSNDQPDNMEETLKRISKPQREPEQEARQ